MNSMVKVHFWGACNFAGIKPDEIETAFAKAKKLGHIPEQDKVKLPKEQLNAYNQYYLSKNCPEPRKTEEELAAIDIKTKFEWWRNREYRYDRHRLFLIIRSRSGHRFDENYRMVADAIDAVVVIVWGGKRPADIYNKANFLAKYCERYTMPARGESSTLRNFLDIRNIVVPQTEVTSEKEAYLRHRELYNTDLTDIQFRREQSSVLEAERRLRPVTVRDSKTDQLVERYVSGETMLTSKSGYVDLEEADLALAALKAADEWLRENPELKEELGWDFFADIDVFRCECGGIGRHNPRKFVSFCPLCGAPHYLGDTPVKPDDDFESCAYEDRRPDWLRDSDENDYEFLQTAFDPE